MANKNITHKMIDKHKLIRVFKMFKNQPKKIFVASEFSYKANTWIIRNQYLRTLIVLGLIEQVPTVYKCGRKYKSKRMVKGYRLK